jgi:hypothetical protein
MLNIHEDKAKLGRLLRSQEPREGDASNIILTTFGHYLRLVLTQQKLLLIISGHNYHQGRGRGSQTPLEVDQDAQRRQGPARQLQAST